MSGSRNARRAGALLPPLPTVPVVAGAAVADDGGASSGGGSSLFITSAHGFIVDRPIVAFSS